MSRHTNDIRFKNFEPQPDAAPKLLEFANEKLEPDTAPISGDFYRVTIEDGPPTRLTMESGEPRTATHRVFRLTLGSPPFSNGSFRTIGIDDVRRWEYLKNPWRTAERKAGRQLFEDLQAGRLPRVTESQVRLITQLPPNAFDLMGQDPHGPPISTDPVTGIRSVRAPDLLHWFDHLSTPRRTNGNGDAR